MPTYQSTNPLARTNPLRSIPFMRPASALWRPAYLPDEPTPVVVAAPVDLVRELANAEALLRECVRVYDAARAGIGEANQHILPDTLPSFIRGQSGPFVPVRLSAERIRERKSYAFKLFNKRRGELTRARPPGGCRPRRAGSAEPGSDRTPHSGRQRGSCQQASARRSSLHCPGRIAGLSRPRRAVPGNQTARKGAPTPQPDLTQNKVHNHHDQGYQHAYHVPPGSARRLRRGRHLRRGWSAGRGSPPPLQRQVSILSWLSTPNGALWRISMPPSTSSTSRCGLTLCAAMANPGSQTLGNATPVVSN